MKKNLKRACAVIAALMLAAFAQAESPEASPTPKPKLEIDPNAGARVTPTPSPTPEPVRNIVIPGWSDISFDANAEELVIDLFNPEENADYFYLTFRLYIVHETENAETGEIETTEEEVFQTGLVPPGLAVNSVTLDHKIEKGEYNAIMFVQPYTMDTLAECNSVNFPIRLTVF